MTTFGIVSCGELGAAFARLLIARGMDVVTTLEGRSARTLKASREAGLRELSSLYEVARASDIVLSVAPPNTAETLAKSYLQCCAGQTHGIFVDVNSVGPATTGRMAAGFAERAVAFVDAALVGPASCLTTSATLYLSGEPAQQVAGCLGSDVRTKVLGPQVGEASSLKMLLGGMNKGIAALFLELALAAEEMGSLSRFLAEYMANYPCVMRLLDRMVPTYAQHARRRGHEVGELEEMIRSLGMEPSVAAGARRAIDRVSMLKLEPAESTQALIRQVAARRQGVSAPPVPERSGKDSAKS